MAAHFDIGNTFVRIESVYLHEPTNKLLICEKIYYRQNLRQTKTRIFMDHHTISELEKCSGFINFGGARNEILSFVRTKYTATETPKWPSTQVGFNVRY